MLGILLFPGAVKLTPSGPYCKAPTAPAAPPTGLVTRSLDVARFFRDRIRTAVKPEIIVGDRERLSEALGQRVETATAQALADRRRFAIALPGGSVATSFFPRLANSALDWSRVDFFWGDERAVPEDDPESNYGAARKLWLEPAGVPASCVHRMPADSADLPQAALAHAAELERLLGSPPSLDVALLGMGPDGHVCSLFPGHPLLRDESRWVAAILDSPKPPPRRLTLTLPVLAAARLVVVAAMGESKAEPIQQAVLDPASELPVALALRRAPRSLLLLDSAAARRLA